MDEEFYTCAIGNKEKKCYGIQYDAYSIFAFRSKEKAEGDMQKTLDFVNSKNLEGVIINITPLVQIGIIPREKLKIID